MADNKCFDVEEARTLITDARYELDSFVGAGAMACVYKVRETGTPNIYALKLLREEYSRRPKFLDFFEREALHMRDLQYPNIVRFYKFVREERSAYILMDYVEGKPLTDYVKEARESELSIPLAKIVRLMAQVARALNYLHREGFIHRDVKPGNILLAGKNESAYLTDLGILGASMAEDPALRGAGTPSYMPYEQQLTSQVNHTVDIYAFAIMLFELFTGEKPFVPQRGLSFNEARKAVVELHRKAPIPPISEWREELPPEMDAIFERALAKKPDERYQDILEFAEDIHELLLPQLPPDLQNFENIKAGNIKRSAQPDAPIAERDYRIIIGGLIALIIIVTLVAAGIFFTNDNGQQTPGDEITEDIVQSTEAEVAATITPSPTNTAEATIPPTATDFFEGVARLSLADGVDAIAYGDDLSASVNYIAGVRDGFVPLLAGGELNGFRVELQLNGDTLPDNQQFGIAFRMQDEQNYLLFSADVSESSWSLEAIEAGERQILQQDRIIGSIPAEIVISADNDLIRIDYGNILIQEEITDQVNGAVALWLPLEDEQLITVQELQIDLIGNNANLAGQVSEIVIDSLSPLYFILEDVDALQATVNANAIVDCTRFIHLYNRLERHAEQEAIADFAAEVELLSVTIFTQCQADPDNTALEFSLSDINRWQTDIDALIAGLE